MSQLQLVSATSRKNPVAHDLSTAASPAGRSRTRAAVSAVHGLDAQQQALAPGAASYASQQAAVQLNATLTSTDKKAPHKPVMADPDDKVYEQLAHNHGYAAPSAYTDKQKAYLKQVGYKVQSYHDDKHTDAQCTLFVGDGSPLGKTRKPVLAFRGTEPKLKDGDTDFEMKCVGWSQFQANRAAIIGLLSSVGGAVCVGHSLGGALAQRTACYYPGLVKRVVGFQAPAIDKASVARLLAYNKANPNKEVTSTHYVAEGDLVSKAGTAHTPDKGGTTPYIVHDPGGSKAKLEPHRRYLLDGKAKHLPQTSSADKPKEKPVAPQTWAEWGRKGLRVLLDSQWWYHVTNSKSYDAIFHMETAKLFLPYEQDVRSGKLRLRIAKHRLGKAVEAAATSRLHLYSPGKLAQSEKQLVELKKRLAGSHTPSQIASHVLVVRLQKLIAAIKKTAAMVQKRKVELQGGLDGLAASGLSKGKANFQ